MARVRFKKTTTYKVMKYIYDMPYNFLERSRTISEAYRRTINFRANYVDAEITPGVLRAQVATELSDDIRKPVYGVINLQVVDNQSDLWSRYIIKDGELQKGFKFAETAEGLQIKHVDGHRFKINDRIFAQVPERGSLKYSMMVKNNSAMRGIRKGLYLLGFVPNGTNYLSYALLRKSIHIAGIPVWGFVNLFGNNWKMAIALTFVNVALGAVGILAFLNAFANKGAVKGYKNLLEIVPESWTGVRSTITDQIDRLEPQMIDQKDRIGQQRRFLLYHEVRGVLDNFQNKTNDAYFKIWYIEWNKRELDRAILKLRAELKKENKDQKLIESLRQEIMTIGSTYNYFIERFFQWVDDVQRGLDYLCERYVFYNENWNLYNTYWNEFSEKAKKGEVIYDPNFRKEFRNPDEQDPAKRDATMYYGLWIATSLRKGYKTEELKKILSLIKGYRDQFKQHRKDIEAEFGVSIQPKLREFTNVNNFLVQALSNNETLIPKAEKNDIWSRSDKQNKQLAEQFVGFVNQAEADLIEKKIQYKQYHGKFNKIYTFMKGPGYKKFPQTQKDDYVGQALIAIIQLYTLRIVGFYQWKWSVRAKIEVMLHEIDTLPKVDRKKVIAGIKKLSDNKMIIKERVDEVVLKEETTLINVYSFRYKHWYGATRRVGVPYEDPVMLQRVNIDMQEALVDIEGKFKYLQKLGINLIPPNFFDDHYGTQDDLEQLIQVTEELPDNYYIKNIYQILLGE